jgi:hypothetical protein
MKYLLLVLLSLSAISCASHDRDNREPSSVAEERDVSRGLNADYYGGSR